MLDTSNMRRFNYFFGDVKEFTNSEKSFFRSKLLLKVKRIILFFNEEKLIKFDTSIWKKVIKKCFKTNIIKLR